MNTLTAMTFSVPADIKQDVDRIAAREHRSKSDVFRDMYRTYKFGRALDTIQARTRATALRLGIETDDDVAAYLNDAGASAGDVKARDKA